MVYKRILVTNTIILILITFTRCNVPSQIEYRVLARPYDTNFKFNIFSAFKVHRVVDLSSLEAVIVDLEPSTKYELQIWAVNHAGIEGHKDRLDVYTEMATGMHLLSQIIMQISN